MRTFTTIASLAAGFALFTVSLHPADALRWPPDNNPTATVVRARSTRKVKKLVLTDAAKLVNEKRRKDVKTISNAVFFHKRDNNRHIPESIPLNTAKEICRMDASDCSGFVDLTEFVQEYIEEFPVDPASPKNGNGTGYFIHKDFKGRIIVSAPAAEDGWIIKETK